MPEENENTEGGEQGGEQGSGSGEQQSGSDKTFTQADVDRIVQDRLARAKTAPPSDYDDLKAKAAKLDELEESQKDELQKANERAEKAEKAAAEALESAKETSLRTAVVSAAAAAGAANPDVVAALVDKNAVTVGDDGQVTGADDAVKFLLKNEPYLVGKTTGSADGGARGSGNTEGQLSRDDLKNMTPQQIVKAKADGLLDGVLGGAT